MEKNRKVGRPTKFTKQVKDTILQHIAEGHFLTTACNLSKVSYNCFWKWIEEGKNCEKEGNFRSSYYRFYLDVEQARGFAEDFHLNKIVDSDDWRASAWYLSVTRPDKFGNKKSVEVTTEDNEININVRTVTCKEDIDKLCQEKES